MGKKRYPLFFHNGGSTRQKWISKCVTPNIFFSRAWCSQSFLSSLLKFVLQILGRQRRKESHGTRPRPGIHSSAAVESCRNRNGREKDSSQQSQYSEKRNEHGQKFCKTLKQ